MSDGEREELLAKTEEAAAKGDYELFKTRSVFDSTAKNPEWLGEEPDRIAHLMPDVRRGAGRGMEIAA